MTTRKPKNPDQLKSGYIAPAPSALWVADVTNVRTRKEFIYTTFVTDVFSWQIARWALPDSMRTEALPLNALNQTIVSLKKTTGLVHHSDHGSQYVSIVFNERPY